jgi:hypothetical protein
MKKLYTKITPITLLFGLSFGMLSACGTGKNAQTAFKMQKRNDKELMQSLAEQDEIGYDFFTVRIGVDVTSEAQNAAFSCYVKMKVDSAFSGSIKKANFVIGSYLITQDSLFFVDKLKDCYIAQPLLYFSGMLGTDVEYAFFQDLILGKAIGFDPDGKYKQIDSEDHFILSTHKERAYKKLENDRLNIEEDLVLIQYHLSGETMRLAKIEMEVPADKASISIEYLEQKEVNGFMVPEETHIKISHLRDTVMIKLNYATVKINEPRRIQIKIPEDYNECE